MILRKRSISFQRITKMTSTKLRPCLASANIVPAALRKAQRVGIFVTQRLILRFSRCTDGVKLSIGCKNTATGNGNLQPEIEINEYSSSKKITRVVYYSSSTRVLAAALPICNRADI